jgi:hypothetical protein
MNNITDDGEAVQSTDLAILGNSAVAQVARAEIDAQISTARAFPRDIRKVMNAITTLATLDEESAQESLYALVRSSKKKRGQDDAEKNTVIEGPSIRLAEIAMQCYGNCRAEARVIEIDLINKQIVAEGIFLDLESNAASKTTVRRSIAGKYGLFSQDMITVTGNAACAIAKRNAILSGIPKGLYRPAYQRAREIVAGTAETLTKNRDKAIKAFAAFGVKPEQLFEKLEVEGELDLTQEHIVQLRGMFATLKNAEASVEEMFGREQSTPAPLTNNPLVDKKPDGTAIVDILDQTSVQGIKEALVGRGPAAEETAAAEQVVEEVQPEGALFWISPAGEVVKDNEEGLAAQALKRANKGTASLQRWLKSLAPEVVESLQVIMHRLTAIAGKADAGAS